MTGNIKNTEKKFWNLYFSFGSTLLKFTLKSSVCQVRTIMIHPNNQRVKILKESVILTFFYYYTPKKFKQAH